VTTTQTAAPDRVCIVGAGPSGLVVARQLRAAGVPFDIFERHSGLGGIWDPQNVGSPIYRSAHFISSRYCSGFYAHPMPESFPDYPSWRNLLSYINDFAADEGLDRLVTFNSTVEKAVLAEDGTWRVTVNGAEKRYRAVVAAPGVTWHPNVPELVGQDSFTGEIRHASTYFDHTEFAGKRVVIVGGGNSGVDIACDAAMSADAAFISLRRGYWFLPKHIFGVTMDVFFDGGPPAGVTLPEDLTELVAALNGDLTKLGLQEPDHRVLESHPIANDQILHYLRHGDITAKPDVDRLEGDEVVFVDGSREKADLVLLATGYEYRLPFLEGSLFEWKHGHPQLYLNIFSRTVDSLYVLGFIEFADAAYKRFEDMAQLIAMDLTLTGEQKVEFQEMKRNHRPDLREGMHYIDTPRHANYVEVHTYQRVLAEIREKFGLKALEDVYGVSQAVA
jgi:hypothetical protein